MDRSEEADITRVWNKDNLRVYLQSLLRWHRAMSLTQSEWYKREDFSWNWGSSFYLGVNFTRASSLR